MASLFGKIMGHTGGTDAETSAKRGAKSKFEKRELTMIRNAFHDLALRSCGPGKEITKVAFLRRFSLPGLLGDRLFSVLDPKGNKAVSWPDFMVGMGHLLRGTREEKLNFIFKMYDMQGRGKIYESDLGMMLYSMAAIRIPKPGSQALLSHDDEILLTEEEAENMSADAFQSSAAHKDADTGEEEKSLSPKEFNDWVEKYPEVVEAVEHIFHSIVDTSSVASEYAKMRLALKDQKKKRARHGDTKNSHMSANGSSRVHSPSVRKRQNTTPKISDATSDKGVANHLGTPTPTSRVARALSRTSRVSVRCRACNLDLDVGYDMSTGEVVKPEDINFCPECGGKLDDGRNRSTTTGCNKSHEGYLQKIGHRFRQLMQRWFVIRNGFLHEFHGPKDVEAVSSTFLPGCFVEAVSERDKAKLKYGLEIIMKEEPRKSRLLYAQSIGERDSWIRAIKAHAIAEAPWKVYEKKEELGVGRFSSVVCAVHKTTQIRYAMKIIEKLSLDEKEQEALHTEIAVLKLVNHPNILQLKHVFETRRQLFIISNLVGGGDLFDRLDKVKMFGEHKSRILIKKLLSVVDYLHSRGVVHRDLKPENILTTAGDDFDIILGDFGLARFAAPHQKMTLACGTPAYVAPEVWEMRGYDSRVDIWSVGVMTYFFICGRLPFNGKDRKELQQQTQHSKLTLAPAKIWDEVSKEALELMRALLQKGPSRRPRAKRALEYAWFKMENDSKDTSKSPLKCELGAQQDKKEESVNVG
eukprot:CAMPEP_0114519762 /NCGR_PEP_ID=MMETSP0109-20121206/19191_1 /TAXON_ID=29199 /ORGANISM="Chlorarachnion reptans, Strain CCCM449" /LENGTH=751 /DNA_ID=CAMNT_0001700553 /DNA_START=299 /DNA_END=2551 /DNA_ORIENTATION=+